MQALLTLPPSECRHRDLYAPRIAAHRIWFRRTAPGRPREAYEVLLPSHQYVLQYFSDGSELTTPMGSPNCQCVPGPALRQAIVVQACTRILDRVRGFILLGDRTGV